MSQHRNTLQTMLNRQKELAMKNFAAENHARQMAQLQAAVDARETRLLRLVLETNQTLNLSAERGYCPPENSPRLCDSNADLFFK